MRTENMRGGYARAERSPSVEAHHRVAEHHRMHNNPTVVFPTPLPPLHGSAECALTTWEDALDCDGSQPAGARTVNQSGQHPKSGQLGTADVTASTVLGALTLVVPFVELCKPGQPAPYSEFPYVALAIVAAAIVIACVTVHRHPSTGSSEGTTTSDP